MAPWDEKITEGAYQRYKLAEKYGDFHYPAISGPELKLGHMFKIFDYLDLDGGLSWLQLPDGGTAEQMKRHQMKRPAADENVMREFEHTASRLELTLPNGFARFMTSATLQSYVPSAQASYLSFGDPLLKFRTWKIATFDGITLPAADGYAVRKYRDGYD